MSVVTNLIISTCETEDGDLIARWLSGHYGGVFPCDIYDLDTTYDNQVTGGTKSIEASVRIAVYNHLKLDELLAAMADMAFSDVDMVQLFVQEQEDNCFTERFQPSRKLNRGAGD